MFKIFAWVLVCILYIIPGWPHAYAKRLLAEWALARRVRLIRKHRKYRGSFRDN